MHTNSFEDQSPRIAFWWLVSSLCMTWSLAVAVHAENLQLQPKHRAKPSATHSGPEQANFKSKALAEAEDLNHSVMRAYQVGEYERAVSLAQRSLEIRQSWLGPDHPDVAQSMNNLAVLYKAQRQYDAAERLYKRSLAIREKALGPDHPDVATSMNNLAELCRAQGRYEAAESMMKGSLAIREKALGSEHPNVAQSLNNLAGLYESQGRYDVAEPLFKRSLSIWKKTLGPDHTEVAASLNNLAGLYKSQGRYDLAEPLYKRSLAIREKTLGAAHPEVATSLNNLAGLYQWQGRYDAAEPLHKRSLAIRENALGTNHPHVATSLNNLAELNKLQGRYDSAEALFKRSLAILETALGADHPNVATVLSNLARLYTSQSRFEVAKPLIKRSLAIREKKLKPDHPDIARSLNSLASLYESQGRYDVAEPLFNRSLEILETRLGADNPYVASLLSNLAGLYMLQGRYGLSEPMMKRSLAIREKMLGPDHSDVAESLNFLAGLYQQQGRHEAAESLFKRSLAIREKALGPDHRSVAQSLNNLAWYYKSQSHYDAAEPLIKRSLAILEKALGPDDLEVCYLLNNLADLYMSQGRYHAAEPIMKRSLAIREKMLGTNHADVARSLNNLAVIEMHRKDLQAAWQLAVRAQDVLVSSRQRFGRTALTRSSFLSKHSDEQLVTTLALATGKRQEALTRLERGRALGLRELLAQAKAQAGVGLSTQDQTKVRQALGQINTLNQAIERVASTGAEVKELQLRLGIAERDYEAILGDLATEHAPFVAVETNHAISAQEAIQTSALDSRTAIIGWSDFHDWHWGYVVRPTGIHWIDLAKAIDGERYNDDLRSTINLGHRLGWEKRKTASTLHNVYRRRLAPLQSYLEGVEKLIVVAQGWAARIPFEMLLTQKPNSDELDDPSSWAWLGDCYTISYTPSITTLDLLAKQRRKDHNWHRDLFVLADPPFSQEQLKRMQAEAPVATVAMADTEQALRETLRHETRATPPRLPGTRYEANSLAKLQGQKRSVLLLGPDASERRLFELNRSGELAEYRYVHLATHGFLDDERPELSGLVLAWAPLDTHYDGLLHMREVFHLRLNADLVVLSACQTGLGKQMTGEGMVGLSTAFFFAGTPTVVMSLWQVDDGATALLMRRFYENLASDGVDKAEALREAKYWLRRLWQSELEALQESDPQLMTLMNRGVGTKPQESPKGERKDFRPFAHPHYWAAFILAGDPT